MKNETLLEKAKKMSAYNHKGKIIIDEEHLDLALSWMKGEITLSQVNRVLDRKTNSGNTLYHIATWLKEAYNQKKIVLTNKK